VQSKRTIDLYGRNFVHMVAWKSVFLLQCLEIGVSASVSGNERGLLLAPHFAADDKMGAPREETDVM
jgi:hypothetical protein